MVILRIGREPLHFARFNDLIVEVATVFECFGHVPTVARCLIAIFDHKNLSDSANTGESARHQTLLLLSNFGSHGLSCVDIQVRNILLEALVIVNMATPPTVIAIM